MTEEEYAEKVSDTANAILTECDAREWKKENEGEGFHEFENEKECDGQIHSILDATCGLGNWKDAVDILQATNQEPEHVDSGLYESCGWQRILIIIAFEVFRWDVYEVMQTMFEEDDFEDAVLQYPDTQHQRGFFPKTKKFKIQDGPWVVEMGGAVKVLVQRRNTTYDSRESPELSVVFEGAVEKMGKNHVGYIVDCRRVYNQTQTDIKADLTRCKEEFGVREV
jgi:hypothetical protein